MVLSLLNIWKKYTKEKKDDVNNHTVLSVGRLVYWTKANWMMLLCWFVFGTVCARALCVCVCVCVRMCVPS